MHTGGVDLERNISSFLQSVFSLRFPDLNGHFSSPTPDLLKKMQNPVLKKVTGHLVEKHLADMNSVRLETCWSYDMINPERLKSGATTFGAMAKLRQAVCRAPPLLL
jgi:hypothetical protein